MPVRFDECEIPDWEIGGGRTLSSIQRADLFGEGADEGAARLVAAILRILGRHSEAKQDRSSVPHSSGLIAAELRLLPLLSTHLSFPEIAVELFLSPNTVKSQAQSIYRKLVGVRSRSQAVDRARRLGLLDSP